MALPISSSHVDLTPSLVMDQPNGDFGSVLSSEEISKTLLLDLSTPDLVAQAQDIAREWDNDVLCQHSDQQVYTGSLLRALLDHASKDPIPGYPAASGIRVTGERYTAAVVVSAHQASLAHHSKVREVALAWLGYMLSYVKNAALKHRDTRPSSGPPSSNEQNLNGAVATAQNVKEFREKIFERDGHSCNVHSGELDHEYHEKLHRSAAGLAHSNGSCLHTTAYMEVAHILPFFINGYEEPGPATTDSDSDAVARRRTAITQNMLQRWAALDTRLLTGDPGILNERNALLLCPNSHAQFAHFTIYFAATAQVNHYQVMPTDSRRLSGPLSEHTFHNSSSSSDDDGEDIALPSPKYLSVHAAFARVFSQSGAGEYLESLFEDIEEIAIFAADGSTDVGGMLGYRLGVV